MAINYLGGYRNTMTLVLTGLDIEEKAAWAEQELFGILGGRDSFGEVDVRLLRFDRPDAPTNEQATAHLRITVKDPDPRKVGRAFSGAVMELALGGYPGFHTTTPPTPESAYGVYWPALVPAGLVEQAVVLPDGRREVIPPAPARPAPAPAPGQPTSSARSAASARRGSGPADVIGPPSRLSARPGCAPAGGIRPGPAAARFHTQPARGRSPDPPGPARPGLRGPVRRQGRQRQHRRVDPRRGRVTAGCAST